MNIQGCLGLSISETKQNLSKSFGDFNMVDIALWQKGLPKSDIGAMAKSIYYFLTEMNQTELHDINRYEALVKLHPTITMLTIQMNELYLHNPEIAHDVRKKIALLIEAIFVETSIGYKRILQAMINNRKKKDLVLKCLHQVGILSFELIKLSYQMYNNAPPRVWLELHTLYQIAEKKRLLTKDVEPIDGSTLRYTCFAHIYKHALLLACANPYRLRTLEFHKLHDALEVWSPLIDLHPHHKGHQDLFIVDLNQDLGPRYINAPIEHTRVCLGLNLSKVVSRLENLKQIEAFEKSDEVLTHSELALQSNVVAFLHSAWTDVGERGADRIPHSGNMRIILGLTQVFNAISTQPSDPIDRDAVDQSPDHGTTEEINFDLISLPQISEGTSLAYDFINALLVNVSTTGLCLEFQEPPISLKTGEVIAVEQNPENEGQLSIGVVCWIKLVNQKPRCGIKLLGPFAEPVYTFIPQQKALKVKTLLIPPEPNFNERMTLITPARPFKAGVSVDLLRGDKTIQINLLSNVESTSSINQFTIQSDDESLVDSPISQPRRQGPSDDQWQQMDIK